MDSTNLSLADFMNTPGLDIMKRADMFAECTADYVAKRHMQWKRVALDGSAPVRRVIDPYTGEIREMIYLASNDYLNLTRHPKVMAAGLAALEKYGAGAGSVPLLGGTLDIHIQLEKRLAEFKSCESAIIYTSGFGSNAGTLLALLQEEDIAVLDMLVHASVIDGCKNTNIKYFKHNDMDSLEKALAKVQNTHRTKLVVVDGVYSMDGDIAKLDQIVEIAHRYGAYVMVDEAHASGVIGENGRGTPEHCHVEGKVDIVAGTLSKALGAVGGFIASNKNLINLLNYYSRSYMFSTAMTPQVAGSLIAAIDVIENEPELREQLWSNINYFHKHLVDLGFDLGDAETAIFPIIVGDDWKVREICRYMHEHNIYVNPVLYPAVHRRATRVRMSLYSTE
jgi:glycine C-acetyltransferase